MLLWKQVDVEHNSQLTPFCWSHLQNNTITRHNGWPIAEDIKTMEKYKSPKLKK